METSQKIQDTIYQAVRERILNGLYHPGKKIGEIALAKEFGCSRTPIRDSLKRLEQDRLLEIRPKSGTYVRIETKEEYQHLMEVRAYMESLAYKILYPAITHAQLANLQRTLRDMNRKKIANTHEMSEYAEYHLSFHLSLIEYAGNPLLLRFFKQLNFRTSNMLYFSMDEAVLRKTQAEHEQILDCLARHDPAGEDFMRKHILQSMEEHLRIWGDSRLPCTS